jgi:hypothetical protein
MTLLRILAGATAYRHIKTNGLTQQDISAVFAASGAAKWLTIYGLDRAVFSVWLAQSIHPIDLFGTSIGTFKLAAAAQQKPSSSPYLAESIIVRYLIAVFLLRGHQQIAIGAWMALLLNRYHSIRITFVRQFCLQVRFRSSCPACRTFPVHLTGYIAMGVCWIIMPFPLTWP